MLRRYILPAVLLAVAAGGSTPAADGQAGEKDAAAKAAMKELEGNWKLLRQEYKGKLVPGVDQTKEGLFIEDGKILWTVDGKDRGRQKGELTVDPTAKPAALDVAITRGSAIGKKLLGIYELKGDKLTICWGEAGEDKRPQAFDTKTGAGRGVWLDTYQKVKE